MGRTFKPMRDGAMQVTGISFSNSGLPAPSFNFSNSGPQTPGF